MLCIDARGEALLSTCLVLLHESWTSSFADSSSNENVNTSLLVSGMETFAAWILVFAAACFAQGRVCLLTGLVNTDYATLVFATVRSPVRTAVSFISCLDLLLCTLRHFDELRRSGVPRNPPPLECLGFLSVLHCNCTS